MNMIERVEHWGDRNHSTWLDILRIGVGLLLMVKGISFISDTTKLSELVSSLNISLWTVPAVHYVAFAHMFGGFLIALGVLTRIASIIQIPILVTAVFFVNLRMGFSFLNSELWLSLLTLVLVIAFAVSGSGRLSMDEWLRTHDH